MKQIHNFAISKFPVTKIQWDAVALWAKDFGYTDLTVGYGQGNRPVGCVDWYNAIKFCNALSELAELIPVYYDYEKKIYKNGKIDLSLKNINADSNGYRLPTAHEWEIACRAGSDTKYFWGNDFEINCGPKYAWYTIGGSEDQATKEVGLLLPNEFGLYDMLGNVFEWCFDCYEGDYRVIRGGSVALDSILECGHISYTSPNYECYETGFRLVSSNLNAAPIEETAKKSSFFGRHVQKEAVYPDMSEKAVALRLYKDLGDSEEQKEIKRDIESGDYDGALLKFKRLFINRFKAHDFSGVIRFDAFKDMRFQNTLEGVMASEANSPWYGMKNECLLRHDFAPVLLLAAKYYETGAKKYFNKFFELINSFLLRHKAEYDVLNDEMLNQKQTARQSWAWFMGFDTCMRMINLIYAMWCVVSSAEDAEDISPVTLAQFSVSLMNDHLYTMIKDGRERVPNQKFFVAKGYFILADIFAGFKSCVNGKNIMEERFKSVYESFMYPDGTLLEQAFNYNGYMVTEYVHLKSMLNDTSMLECASEYVSKLNRMLCVTCTPTGEVPPLGTYGGLFPPDLHDAKVLDEYKSKVLAASMKYYDGVLWNDWKRIMDYVLKGGNDVPKFTSVFFPYNSQAVIRDSFDVFSRYMFFYAPRKGLGHAAENINEIYLSAFGRPMLISSGANSYGMKYHCIESQYEIMNQIDKYQYSSFGRNTICVDDSSQSRLKNGESCVHEKYKEAVGNKWHHSDEFIYTQGKYSDGYYACDDVCHHREVFYDKRTKLFFILDTLSGNEPHKYTQNWGFMPNGVKNENADRSMKWISAGYDDDMIFIKENCIYTNDKNSPNIFLYQFSNEKISYTRHRGELNPARGWLAPSIAGERYPKTDINASWTSMGNISAVLTVIETAETEKSEISSIEKICGENICGCKIFLKSGEVVSFCFGVDSQKMELEGFEFSARAALVRKTNGVIIGSEGKHFSDFEFNNSNINDANEIKAPRDMLWEEKDGYSLLKYE